MPVDFDKTQLVKENRSCIGGSDSAAVLGVDPWRTALEAWAEKVGLIEREVGEAAEWGTRLEDVIVEKFLDVHPEIKLVTTVSDEFIVRDGWSFWGSHPDRIIEHEQYGPGVLEIKNRSEYLRRDIQTMTPLPPRCQLQHNIAACKSKYGTTWGALAFLIGGNSYIDKFEFANPDIVRAMEKVYQEFWHHVQSGTRPAAKAAGDGKVLDQLLGVDPDQTVYFESDQIELDEEYQRKKKEGKEIELRLDTIKALLKDYIGEAAVGMVDTGANYWRRSTVTPKGKKPYKLFKRHGKGI